jgi:hypothetical protein
MNTENGLPEEVLSEKDSELDRVESRRRLLKAGLVAVPFLVTLHALPARAGGARGQGSLGVYGYGDDRDRGGGHGKGSGTSGGRNSSKTGQGDDR